MLPEPRTEQYTTLAHDHHRGSYCPAAMFPQPLVPTKPRSIWLFAFAAAVLHHETFTEFVAAWPAEFTVTWPDEFKSVTS